MHLPVSLMHCIVNKLLSYCAISSNLGWGWKISGMEWFYLIQEFVCFFYPRSLRDEALNDTGCEKTAAVWIDWNPKCYMKWLTWRWMGVNAVSSDFPPTVGRNSQVGGWSTNHPELLSQSNGPYGTSAEQKMHTDGTFRSRDLFYLLYSPHLYSLLCCFLHRFHSWRSENMSVMYCSCAGNRRAVCAVWSNAWKLPSLCVPFSVGQMLHRVNCRSPHICQHRRWHLLDRCHTWRMWAPEGWSATRDLQPVTHGKV